MLTRTQALPSWLAPRKRERRSDKWNNAWMTITNLKRLICRSVEEIDKSKEDGDTELLVSIMRILNIPRSSTRMQRELRTTAWTKKVSSMARGLKHSKSDLVHRNKCQSVPILSKGLRVYSRINPRQLLISTKNGSPKTSWLGPRLSSIHTKEYTSLPPTSTGPQKMAAWKKSNLRDRSNWERRICEIVHST